MKRPRPKIIDEPRFKAGDRVRDLNNGGVAGRVLSVEGVCAEVRWNNGKLQTVVQDVLTPDVIRTRAQIESDKPKPLKERARVYDVARPLRKGTVTKVGAQVSLVKWDNGLTEAETNTSIRPEIRRPKICDV